MVNDKAVEQVGYNSDDPVTEWTCNKRRSKRRINLPAEEICYLDWSPVSSPYLSEKGKMRNRGACWERTKRYSLGRLMIQSHKTTASVGQKDKRQKKRENREGDGAVHMAIKSSDELQEGLSGGMSTYHKSILEWHRWNGPPFQWSLLRGGPWDEEGGAGWCWKSENKRRKQTSNSQSRSGRYQVTSQQTLTNLCKKQSKILIRRVLTQYGFGVVTSFSSAATTTD